MKITNVILLSLFLVLGIAQPSLPCYGIDDEKEARLASNIGQLLLVGFQGTRPEEEGPKRICDLLQQQKLGGVILYGYNIVNPEQLRRLTQAFYEANNGAFIAVDQEGGLVQRLVAKKGFNTTTPAAQDVAQLSTEKARELYCLMAEELKNYRININFGPDVDLNNPTHPSPAIGKYKRSYSDDPEIVSQFARLFIEEHRKKGIITAAKHFPGHGYSTEDTHKGIADTTKTAIPEKELKPYQNLLALGDVDMIMTAHIVNKNYDPEGYPATLSPVIIPTLLRQQLGYTGVVVSDDLDMGAIKPFYGIDEIVTRALNATCDFLVFSGNAATAPNLPAWNPDLSFVENIIAIVLQNIRAGKIPLERILESHERLAKLKATVNQNKR